MMRILGLLLVALIFSGSLLADEPPPEHLGSGVPGAPEEIIGPGVVPVIDTPNLIQALLDHAKRLFEIVQRAEQLIQGARNLEFWLQALTKEELIPYRPSILEFLEEQQELMRAFEEGRQHQALSYALPEAGSEFDLTYPGWQAMSELTTGSSLTLETEAGHLSFDSPLEYAEYQAARALQVHRQALQSTSDHRLDIFESEIHLAGLEGEELINLADAASETEGLQQILEVQTAFAALTSRQLIALRNQLQAFHSVAIADAGHELNREMQAAASQSHNSAELAAALTGVFGTLLPPATRGEAISPYPAWTTAGTLDEAVP